MASGRGQAISRGQLLSHAFLASGLARLGAVAVVAAIGSALNSIAGAGTLLTFPALIALGIPALIANATSTVALWPGSLGSMLGYRRELAGVRPWAVRFAVPSLAGGLAGALLLVRTPADRFRLLAPWLVLAATALYVAQPPITRWLQRRGSASGPNVSADAAPTTPPRAFLLYQFLVAIYGGYFGAGVGILMLGALRFMGLRNIHQMNGLKNWGNLCMNGFAAVAFAAGGIVNWPVAGAMAVGAATGGFAASRVAQRIPQLAVRRTIALVGLAAGGWMLLARL